MLAESGLLEFLQQWHNSLYVTPLLLGLFLLVFQLFGLMGGGHDADTDHDLDADGDVDGDIDGDVDGDVDGDLDHDLDHDVDHDGGSVFAGAFKFLGAGRVPFIAVLQSLLLSVGAAGLIATYALGRSGTVGPGVPMLAASLPIALVSGLLFSKILTVFLGRYFATFESSSRRLGSLEGEKAVVESATVDATQGRAVFHDAAGTEVTVFVRTPISAAPIAKGARIRLDEFLPKDNTFIVSALPPESAGPGVPPSSVAPSTQSEKKEATP